MKKKQPEEKATAECLFCEIAAHRVAAKIVFEDAISVAFLDHRPLFPGLQLDALPRRQPAEMLVYLDDVHRRDQPLQHMPFASTIGLTRDPVQQSQSLRRVVCRGTKLTG